MKTDVREFLSDLDAGILEQKLSQALSDVAAAVIDHNKEGTVILTLKMKRMGNSYQVMVDHKLNYVKPTSKGKVGEENTTQTLMHVGKGGKLSIFPEDQTQMFTKTGEVEET
jgi:hypothetical protein